MESDHINDTTPAFQISGAGEPSLLAEFPTFCLSNSSEHSVVFARTGNHSMDGIYHLRVDLRDGVAAGVLLRLALLSGRFDHL
jgi:hypothetical protein